MTFEAATPAGLNLEAAYVAWYRFIRKCAGRWSGGSDPRRDVIVLDAWERAERHLRAGGRLTASWLRVVVRSVAIDAWRKETARGRLWPAGSYDSPPAVQARVQVDRRKRRRAWQRFRLERALLALDLLDQAAIRLHYFDDKPQAEIARELGISQPNVSRRLRRGLAALREKLGPERDELLADRTRRGWARRIKPALTLSKMDGTGRDDE